MTYEGYSDEEKYRCVARIIRTRTRSFRHVIAGIKTMTKIVMRYVGKDVRDGVPDHYEEAEAMFSKLDGILDLYLMQLRDNLRRLTEVGYYDTLALQNAISQAENQRDVMANLRLDMRRFLLRFEGEPSQAEKLEQMMSAQTPEQEAAEKRLAYETGGASLLQDVESPPGATRPRREPPKGDG